MERSRNQSSSLRSDPGTEHACERCQQHFMIHPDEEAFHEKFTFTFGSSVHTIPLPSLCPDCRCQERTCHRNERVMTKVTSAFSGKEIVSIYHEVSPQGDPVKIFAQDEWRSDGWDPMEYGRDFDFGRSFFEQFYELQRDVPRMQLISIGNENSGFTTGTGYCKNCYLINSSENCEDCFYGKLLQDSKDSVDCSYLYNSQLCYECFSCYDSYSCQYLSFSANCNDCFYSSNLKNCKNCCLCTNLVGKEYHFMNEALDKEEYEKRLKEFRGNYELMQKMNTVYREMMTQMLRKYTNIVNGDNSTGDYLENVRNCLNCFDVNESEDCRNVQVGVNVKDLYDCSNMYLKVELCYQTLGTIEIYGCAFCLFVFHSKRLLYCDYCFNCQDCFGCTGLTRKQFCIFNKQYTEDEYNALVPTLIAHMEVQGEWGKFFPSKFAPFGYNESLASEYYPLEKDEAIAQGFLWRDPDARDYMPQTTEFPPTISAVIGDKITQEIFSCEACTKNYRIIPQELSFYHEHQVPIPHKCPDCRHFDRMQLRNPRKLYDRQCAKCGTAVQSSYAPEKPQTIYCEPCFRSAVYE